MMREKENAKNEKLSRAEINRILSEEKEKEIKNKYTTRKARRNATLEWVSQQLSKETFMILKVMDKL